VRKRNDVKKLTEKQERERPLLHLRTSQSVPRLGLALLIAIIPSMFSAPENSFQTLAVGVERKGELKPGDAQADGRYSDEWLLNLRAGQTLTVEVNSLEFDTRLLVKDHGDNVIAEDDDSGPGTNSRLQFRTAANGVYRIIVSSGQRDEVGSYSVRVVEGTGKPWTERPKAREDLAYFEMALATARKNNNKDWEGRLLRRMGDSQSRLGNHNRALLAYEQALIAFHLTKNRGEEAKARGGLGLALSYLSRFEAATEHFNHAMKVAKELGDHAEESKWGGYLGGAYLYLGQYEKAAATLEDAVTLAREAQDRPMEGKWLSQLGRSYLLLGRLDRAISNYERALILVREERELSQEAKIVGTLGRIYGDMGQYAKSVEHLQLGITLARRLKDQRREAELLGSLGTTYLMLGQHREAIAHFEKALALTRMLNQHTPGQTKNRSP
jgi:tetratricopeptide (TPR) repeat protein